MNGKKYLLDGEEFLPYFQNYEISVLSLIGATHNRQQKKKI
jgi:hypothetical protein